MFSRVPAGHPRPRDASAAADGWHRYRPSTPSPPGPLVIRAAPRASAILGHRASGRWRQGRCRLGTASPVLRRAASIHSSNRVESRRTAQIVSRRARRSSSREPTETTGRGILRWPSLRPSPTRATLWRRSAGACPPQPARSCGAHAPRRRCDGRAAREMGHGPRVRRSRDVVGRREPRPGPRVASIQGGTPRPDAPVLSAHGVGWDSRGKRGGLPRASDLQLALDLWHYSVRGREQAEVVLAEQLPWVLKA